MLQFPGEHHVLVCDVTRADTPVWTPREVLQFQQKNCGAEAAAQKRWGEGGGGWVVLGRAWGDLYSSERANPICCWPLAMSGAASVQFHCEQHTRTPQAHRGLAINEHTHRRRPGLDGEEVPTWGHFYFVFVKKNYLRKKLKMFPCILFRPHTIQVTHVAHLL